MHGEFVSKLIFSYSIINLHWLCGFCLWPMIHCLMLLREVSALNLLYTWSFSEKTLIVFASVYLLFCFFGYEWTFNFIKIILHYVLISTSSEIEICGSFHMSLSIACTSLAILLLENDLVNSLFLLSITHCGTMIYL